MELFVTNEILTRFILLGYAYLSNRQFYGISVIFKAYTACDKTDGSDVLYRVELLAARWRSLLLFLIVLFNKVTLNQLF